MQETQTSLIEPMSTGELARQIIALALDIQRYGDDADLKDVALNTIVELCESQKGTNTMASNKSGVKPGGQGRVKRGGEPDGRLKENKAPKPALPTPQTKKGGAK